MTVAARNLKGNLVYIDNCDFIKLKEFSIKLAKELKFYQEEEKKQSTLLWEERLKK